MKMKGGSLCLEHRTLNRSVIAVVAAPSFGRHALPLRFSDVSGLEYWKVAGSHKQHAVTQLKTSRPIPLHAAAQPAFQVTKNVVASAGAVLDTSDGEGTHYRLTLPLAFKCSGRIAEVCSPDSTLCISDLIVGGGDFFLQVDVIGSVFRECVEIS